MAHIKDQLITAVQAAIVAAGTVAASRVFANRLDPLQAAELPAVMVYEAAGDSQIDENTINGTTKRSVRLRIDSCTGTAPAAPAARALAAAVEEALCQSQPAISAVSAYYRIESDGLATSGDGSSELAAVESVWLFEVWTNRGQPQVAI